MLILASGNSTFTALSVLLYSCIAQSLRRSVMVWTTEEMIVISPGRT